MARQTTHPNKRSRRERALAQREAERKVWSQGPDNEQAQDMARRSGASPMVLDYEKKENIASQEITALKTKLGVRSEA